MAFQVGQNKPAGSGRKRGTPNRKTLGLEEALEARGVDVVAQLAELLPKLPDERRTSVLLDLMSYLYPKRKAVEQQIAVEARVETDRNAAKTPEELGFTLAKLHRMDAQCARDPAVAAAHNLLAEHLEKETENPQTLPSIQA